jgi:hypothetical protein
MDREQGSHCKLKLIPPGLWLTDESEPQVPDFDWMMAVAAKMPW